LPVGVPARVRYLDASCYALRWVAPIPKVGKVLLTLDAGLLCGLACAGPL
jgi:hypothetical protein